MIMNHMIKELIKVSGEINKRFFRQTYENDTNAISYGFASLQNYKKLCLITFTNKNFIEKDY